MELISVENLILLVLANSIILALMHIQGAVDAGIIERPTFRLRIALAVLLVIAGPLAWLVMKATGHKKST